MKKTFLHFFSFHTLYTIICVTICIALSTFLMFHTFSYDQTNSSILIASKLWSDFSAHIPMIRSFSLGENRPLEYPIFPGAPIRYHFLFYFLVGMLEKMGMRIDWAINLPSILGFAGLLCLIGIIAKKLFHRTTVALLSVLFFLCNGSLSFLTFFQKYPLGIHTWNDIVQNTTFTSFAPWDNGVISAFWTLNIYTNQRHLAGAFALGLLVIGTLLFIEKKPLKRQLPYLLLIVPSFCILPFFHQPMLLIIGIFFAWYFIVFQNLRIFIVLTGLLAGFPVLLQLKTLTGEANQFLWHPGYLLVGPLTVQSFLLYWWENLGLHFFLIPLGFLLVPKHVKKIIAPIWFLFIIGNCFKFSVEMAANHKFFNFFMLFGNMLSAYVIVKISTWNGNMRLGTPVERPQSRNLLIQSLYNLKKIFMWSDDSHKHLKVERDEDVGRGQTHKIRQTIMICIVAIFVFFLTLSGIIELFPIINDSLIPLSDAPKNEIVQWILTQTPKDTVFLNSSYMYHPASLAGRKIFLGWPYFAWSAGYGENRMPIMKTMYESRDPAVFCPLFEKYHISYVTVEEVHGNPDLPTIELSYFRSLAEPVYTLNNVYDIYTKDSLCKAKP